MEEFKEEIEYCKTLLRTTQTSTYVYSHSYKVMLISLEIYDLISPFYPLNKKELIIGSLLHDITKTRSLRTHENHSETGGNEARNLGCDEKICQIIEQHVYPNFSNNKITEIEIVCYSDKRVKWDYCVTLKERMEDIIVRYGRNNEQIIQNIKNQNKVYDEIENEIGKLALLNGKEKEFKNFIEKSEEGKVEAFIGLSKNDLI